MSADITITVELSADEAAALHRLCEKITHADAMAYLYGHIAREVRQEQAYHMMHACANVLTGLEQANVASHWPWIETGKVLR